MSFYRPIGRRSGGTKVFRKYRRATRGNKAVRMAITKGINSPHYLNFDLNNLNSWNQTATITFPAPITIPSGNMKVHNFRLTFTVGHDPTGAGSQVEHVWIVVYILREGIPDLIVGTGNNVPLVSGGAVIDDQSLVIFSEPILSVAGDVGYHPLVYDVDYDNYMLRSLHIGDKLKIQCNSFFGAIRGVLQFTTSYI